MIRASHISIGAAIALAVLVLRAVLAFGIGMPEEWTLRLSIATSEYIVAGSVVSIEPFDRRIEDRQGKIVVDVPLWGGASKGDTLLVDWKAARWFPTDSTSFASFGAGVQLDRYVGVPALWRIRLSFAALKVSEPTILSPDSLHVIEWMIGVIDNPPEEDLLNHEFARKTESKVPWPEAEVKIEIVRNFLGAFRQESAGFGSGEGGD